MRPGPSVLLALLAGPALAQDEDIFVPCLAARDSVEAYAQAFEAEGWARTEGAAREEAFQGPAEAYWRVIRFPDPEPTLAALDETLARVRDWAERDFADAAVLTRDGMTAVVQFRSLDPLYVLCLIAAADLPVVDRMLGSAEPGPFGGLAYATLEPPAPPGLEGLRIDAVRIHREVKPAEPLPGTESLIVTFALEGDR